MGSEYWQDVARKRLSRRRLVGGTLAGGAGLAGLGLAACGGGKSKSTATQPKGGTSGAAETPVDGGTLRYTSAASPSAFDPYLNLSYTAQEPWGYITNRVLKYTSGPNIGPDDLNLEPDVAISMPELPEPTRVVVKLRQDVKFHDKPPLNGRQMTAKDIAYSFDRFRAVGQAKNLLDPVDSYEMPDDFTIVFKLKQPSASFITNLASPTLLWIIPKEVVGSDGKVGPQGPFVGAGPFMFDKYDTDVQTSFVKNPNYFLKGLPHIDRVERPIVSDTATVDANFRSGGLTFIGGQNFGGIVDKDRLTELTKAVPGAGVQKYVSTESPHIEMALDRPPFNDLRVRRAFSLAINRDEIAAGLGFIDSAYASPAFPAGYKPYYLDPRSPDFGENGKWFKYDLNQAKQLLTEAGYASGFEVPYHYTTEYGFAKPLAELLFAQLQKAGIKLKLTPYTYTDYQNRFKVGTIEKRRYDGVVDDRPATFPDPGGYFTTYWGSRATRVLSVWDDPQLQAMIDKQDLEIDAAKRLKLFQDIQRYQAGIMAGAPLLTNAIANVWHPQLKNFHFKTDYGRSSESDLQLWLATK